MRSRRLVRKVRGGVRVQLFIQDPPPVPAGFRFAGWHPIAWDTFPTPNPGSLVRGVRDWLAMVNKHLPLHALAVCEDDPAVWLGTSFDFPSGEWEPWMESYPPQEFGHSRAAPLRIDGAN